MYSDISVNYVIVGYKKRNESWFVIELSVLASMLIKDGLFEAFWFSLRTDRCV